jgi:hypothetical protein
MSSLWDTVFIQVLDKTGPPMLNLGGTPYTWSSIESAGLGTARVSDDAVRVSEGEERNSPESKAFIVLSNR